MAAKPKSDLMTIRIERELVIKVDEKIKRKQKEDRGREINRSNVVRQLLWKWVEEAEG